MGKPLRWWRLLRPPRTIRPTKEGWWFLFATFGLGFAAINTGNNLLYLLLSMLLGTIVVSGILSEQCLRRLRLYRAAPREIFAGTPAAVGCLLHNGKRILASYSLTVELPPASRGGALRRCFASKLDAGQQRLFSWEETFPRRGRHQLPAARVMTRFPFGLFLKATHPITLDEFLVFPAVLPLPPEDVRDLGGSGGEREPRPGRGTDLYNLREYRWGDDPRLIHWKSTAKSGAVMVRELEAEAALRVRLVLEDPPPGVDADRLEADISWAASLAAHLIGQGSQVELTGTSLFVPLGTGSAQLRRILEALAVYEPPSDEMPAERESGRSRAVAGASEAGRGTRPVRSGRLSLREIRIPLGARRAA
jgi:uncharacterized protein (DUF58 family)